MPRPAAVAAAAIPLLLCLAAPPAEAQAPPRQARLIITIVDPSGAVVPKATVKLVGLDEVTKKATVEPLPTSEKGVATFERLVPGRYSIQADFPGFDMGLLRDQRIRIGDNRHVVVLPLQKLTAEVTVGRDRQIVASDRGLTFGTTLTREAIEALSDDPAEMQRQLSEMAGPGAIIRVDSFEGSELPPKSQIKSIHVTRDMFAAESHSAGSTFVDIVTQPGIGPLRGTVRVFFSDSALEARNPMVPRKGPSREQGVNLNLSGSLIKERASFSLSSYVDTYYRTPELYAATPDGTRAENLGVRRTSHEWELWGSFDLAVTRDQTLRASLDTYSTNTGNMGIGAYDLVDRAYSTDSSYTNIRIQETGPLGRRFFTNTRLSLRWDDSVSRSSVDAPTIVVNDAFTSGGAQRAGGRHTRRFILQSDLDYVRGIHSWRAGIQFNGGRFRSDDSFNYLGTYTFESLAAYEAGQPRTYTRRIGDPNISYWHLEGAFYLQDDIRVRKTLTLSPGVRFEAQTHLDDKVNIGPRFGLTWAPFKSGKTTLRGSAGIFYDWLDAATFEQTLRVDGLRQQELNIVNPGFPVTEPAGFIPPSNRYLLGPDLRMAENARLSAGVEQQLTKAVRVGAVYAYVRARGLLVGRNLNAPVGGVRPDPLLANEIEAMSAGRSRSHSLALSLNANFQSYVAGGARAGPLWSWKRGLITFGTYTFGSSRNNTDGAFSVPASGDLATEWGPSSGDRRQRFSMTLVSQALRNLTLACQVSASSAPPYTIRTGYDDNGDLIFNDRPFGVGRNSARAASMWMSYASAQYVINFGKRLVPTGQGVLVTSGGGGRTVDLMGGQSVPRYRLTLTLGAQNATNHANYVGYSGIMTSPFFGKPTAVSGMRQITLIAGMSF
jgi:hypothetical protein